MRCYINWIHCIWMLWLLCAKINQPVVCRLNPGEQGPLFWTVCGLIYMWWSNLEAGFSEIKWQQSLPPSNISTLVLIVVVLDIINLIQAWTTPSLNLKWQQFLHQIRISSLVLTSLVENIIYPLLVSRRFFLSTTWCYWCLFQLLN